MNTLLSLLAGITHKEMQAAHNFKNALYDLSFQMLGAQYGLVAAKFPALGYVMDVENRRGVDFQQDVRALQIASGQQLAVFLAATVAMAREDKALEQALAAIPTAQLEDSVEEFYTPEPDVLVEYVIGKAEAYPGYIEPVCDIFRNKVSIPGQADEGAAFMCVAAALIRVGEPSGLTRPWM